MVDTRKKIVLLDTHAILHRAYHALPNFTNDAGEPTGALYGLTTLLLKLIREFDPYCIVACFDRPEATFRHGQFAAYKATRVKADQALIDQIVRSPKVFSAFDIPVLSAAGFEADDILGTIVDQITTSYPAFGRGPATGGDKLQANSYQVIIASGDMDTLQLVEDDRVVVYTLRKGIKDTVIYNEAAVVERFGFVPKLLPDYKGLRGDPSDNIPGVKGIGEKTATELIQKFGMIEEIYKKLKNLEFRISNLDVNAKSKKEKKESKTEEIARIKPRIVELLLANEEEAMFSKMLGTIRRDAPVTFSLPKKSFREAFDPIKAEKIFEELSFRSLIPKLKEIKGQESGVGSQELGNRNSEESSNAHVKLQVDPDVFKRVAIVIWLCDSSLTEPTPEQILVHTKTASFEAAEKKLLSELEGDNMLKLYREIELPLVPILERAEHRGVLIDLDYLGTLAKQYHHELAALEKKIWKHAGEEFNINSPKQLGEILFSKLRLGEEVKGLKKTAGGVASTRVSELEKIKDQHIIVPLLMEYREYQKLLSTYIDVIPTLVDAESRLHTTFVQAGSATGRMASKNPNLQNIPVKTDLGRAIRTAFVATKGYQLAAFDYSQIDLRSAALLSKDPLFAKIFQDRTDVHTAVASVVFRVPPDKVDYEMRRRAKVINFGILYGMGVNALRQNLGTDHKDAEEFYHTYFDRFPGLRNYLDEQKLLAKKQGYTTTYFGRRRYYPNIKSPQPYVRAMEERMAMNAPIQGTSADIIKLAMSKVDEALKKAKLDDQVFPLLQVHDELIYEIKDEAASKAVPLICQVMEAVIPDSPVPLEVHASTGNNWGNLEKV